MSEAKLVVGAIGSLLALILVFVMAPFTIIDTTERGVVLRWGAVDRVLDEGVHWRTPIAEDVIKMPVNTQVIKVTAGAASKDLQEVSTTLAIQYRLDPTEVGLIYSSLKKDYQTVVIDPAIQDAIKAETAKFNAAELITERALVKEAISAGLTARLAEEHILVTNVDIVNFKFSAAFDQAIEEKVTAEQNAQREENKLRQVEFEAQQKIETAKAEAERTRLEAEALASQSGSAVIEKIYAEAALEAAKNWNGVSPTTVVTGGSDGQIPLFPFMQVAK